MVGGVVAQFDGLVEGYNMKQKNSSGAVPALPRFAFQMLNAIGDLFQVTSVVFPGVHEFVRERRQGKGMYVSVPESAMVL
jgi:hypothetical protein